MERLDLFTIAVVSAVNFLLAAIGLFFIYSLGTGSRGIKRCIVACLLISGGIASLTPGLTNSGKPVILLANMMFTCGSICLIDGLRAFRGFRRPVKTYAAVAVAYCLTLCWFLFVHNDANTLFAVRSMFLGAVALSGFVTLVSRVPLRDRRVYWSTAASFGLYAIAVFARAVSALLWPPVMRAQPHVPNLPSLVALNFMGLGCAFGLSVATIRGLQRSAEELARYDGLTKLPNRRLFEERLEEAERHSSATGRGIALIYCDVDNFKGVNDALGHEGGDEALRIVAQRLRRLLPEDTCLARVGGDEFIVLLQNAPSRAAVLELVEKLTAGVEGEIEFEHRRATLGVSCGVATYPDDVNSVSDLIRLADAGMYMMKQHSRFPPPEQEWQIPQTAGGSAQGDR